MYSAVVNGNSPLNGQVGELADGVKCISMPIFYLPLLSVIENSFEIPIEIVCLCLLIIYHYSLFFIFI